MLRNRKGVTLIEIMTVVVLAAIMLAITFPAMKDTRRAASMQSAKTQVESYLAVARSIAIRNGVRSFLIREGNTVRIMADSGNTLVTVVRPVQLDSVSNVLLSSSSGRSADTIMYDNRGLAVNLPASGGKFYITAASGYGAGTKDSVCITRLGLVLDRNCGLVVVSKPDDEVPIDDYPIDDLPTDPIDKGIIDDPLPIDPPIVDK